MIGWLFTDIAQLDLEAHVPRVAAFWETILLDARTYSGGAFAPHAALNARVRLHPGHFERWLMVWRETVDEGFVGARAELAKSHARRVATAFYQRLAAAPLAPPEGHGPGSIVVTTHGPVRAAGTR